MSDAPQDEEPIVIAMSKLQTAIEDVIRAEEGSDAMGLNWILAYEFVNLEEETAPGMSMQTGVNYVALPQGSGPGTLGILSVVEAKIHDALTYPPDDEDEL